MALTPEQIAAVKKAQEIYQGAIAEAEIRFYEIVSPVSTLLEIINFDSKILDEFFSLLKREKDAYEQEKALAHTQLRARLILIEFSPVLSDETIASLKTFLIRIDRSKANLIEVEAIESAYKKINETAKEEIEEIAIKKKVHSESSEANARSLEHCTETALREVENVDTDAEGAGVAENGLLEPLLGAEPQAGMAEDDFFASQEMFFLPELIPVFVVLITCLATTGMFDLSE